MRLLSLSPNAAHPQLVVMAMEDSATEDGCYHYQIARSKTEQVQESIATIVFASPRSLEDEQCDGVTVESLLAICEDQARLRASDKPVMGRITHQLQAALRVLATENHVRPSTDMIQGETTQHVTT